MQNSAITLTLAAGMLALSGCDNQNQARNEEAVKGTEAVKEAGAKNIAASLNPNSRFMVAAKAAGIDATLAGPGPYTVLVPDDAAFGRLPKGMFDNWLKPESRAELTQMLTYHILPGTVLNADIVKAIDQAADKKAALATMGGEILTATRDGDRIVLTDTAGNNATLAARDETLSNGVVHRIDAVMMPHKA